MLTQRQFVNIFLSDPGADARIPLLRCPDEHAVTIEDAYAIAPVAVSASTANYINLDLHNGGTAGTAQTGISGTAGGTAGWAANAIKQMAITAGSGKLTAGQYLVLNYAETGTVAPAGFAVVVEYVNGVGSKAYS